MFYLTKNLPPDYHRLGQLDRLILISCQD